MSAHAIAIVGSDPIEGFTQIPNAWRCLLGKRKPSMFWETLLFFSGETVSKKRPKGEAAPDAALATPSQVAAAIRAPIRTVESAIAYMIENRIVGRQKEGRKPLIRITPGSHWANAKDFAPAANRKDVGSESETRQGKPRCKHRRRVEPGESADISVQPGVETIRFTNTMAEAVALAEDAEPGEIEGVQSVAIEAVSPPRKAQEAEVSPLPQAVSFPQTTDSKHSATESKTPLNGDENRPSERASERSLASFQDVFAIAFGKGLDRNMLNLLEQKLGGWPVKGFVEKVKDKTLDPRTGKRNGKNHGPGILPLWVDDYVAELVAKTPQYQYPPGSKDDEIAQTLRRVKKL